MKLSENVKNLLEVASEIKSLLNENEHLYKENQKLQMYLVAILLNESNQGTAKMQVLKLENVNIYEYLERILSHKDIGFSQSISGIMELEYLENNEYHTIKSWEQLLEISRKLGISTFTTEY